MSFRVWLISLSIMSSRFSHATHTRAHTHTHTHTHTLLYFGAVSIFWLLSVMLLSYRCMNICLSLCFQFLCVCIQKWGCWATGASVSLSEESPRCFLLLLHIIWFSHQPCTRVVFSPHPCLYLSSFYFYNHPNEWEVTLYCGFDLHFLND